MEWVLFILFGLVTVGTAGYVIIAKNPLHSAVSLVGTFFGLACIYVLLQAHFLAVIQVLVYAGAIMVLFLFVVMLLNLTPEQLGRPRLSLTKILAALLVAATLAAMVVWYQTTLRGHFTSSEETASQPWNEGGIAAVGERLFTDYLLPFEIVSVLLLVAIVGAVVIAKRRA